MARDVARSVPSRAAALMSWVCATMLSLVAVGTPVSAQTQAQTQAHPKNRAEALLAPSRSLTQYRIDVWQTEQGLPLNIVQSLLQTQDGTLWVGTAAGLARFDGVRFSALEAAESTELASQPIFGLMEDAQQNLWIGHNKGALIHREGRLRVAFSTEVTAGRRVWSFAQAADGAVWAATENGLVRWQDGAVRRYQQADGLPTNRLRALAFDREGTLWIATSGGGLVSMVDGRFQVLNPANGFPHLQVRSVLADPAGGVWAATAGGGLVRVQDGRIRTYTVADGLPTDQLTGLARDARGDLWIGTWGAGIVRLSEGSFSSIAAAGGLAGEQIWAVLPDREGSVWVATWTGGLNRLRPRAFVALGTPEGLSHNNVRSVLHARNGVTWLGTAGGGVNRIEEGRVTVMGQREGLPTEEISSLLEDREGTLWIGSYTAGIARWRRGRIDLFGPAQGLPSSEVRVLYEDRSGTVWAGTQAGLARFDGRRFVPVTDEGAPRGGVVSMLQDRRGVLWFGTSGDGLVRWQDGRFQTLTTRDGLVSNWVMAMHEDADGSLWIGTNGEGVNRLREGRLAAIRPADGLWDGIALTIQEDAAGFLWISCNRGFYRVARAALDDFVEGRAARVVSVGYGPELALRSSTFAGGLQPAGGVDSQGRVWLPSSSGAVIVDPANLPAPAEPPVARLESVLVDGVRQPPGAEVLLPPGSLPVVIRYTAMTLLNADRVRFRYRMEGLTRDWLGAGLGREAAFPALPHGRYRFRIEASLDGKTWRESSDALAITVRPFVYQTPWFIALALLALASATLALYRLRTRQLHARNAEMERLVAQRTEELRLANEHLARLSFVDALSGLPNRRRFDEALRDEWRRAQRAGTPLAVVMADVDHFKAYNDVLGHVAGDGCLAAVAAVIGSAVGRAGDLAARYGGEEFVLLLPGADAAAARGVAEGLRLACEALAIAHPASSVAPVVTLSLGVASVVPTEGDNPQRLIERADEALYRAKEQGRNRVC